MGNRFVLEPALYDKHVVRDTKTNVVVGFFGHLGNARRFRDTKNQAIKRRNIPVLQNQTKEDEAIDNFLAQFSM